MVGRVGLLRHRNRRQPWLTATALLGLACNPGGSSLVPPTAASRTTQAALDPTLRPDALHALLAELMTLPRALGHAQRQRSILALAQRLTDAGIANVERYRTSGVDPATHTEYALTNVIAHFNPGAPVRFVLATHFDTRPWADEDPDPAAHDQPVPGANDGTSGLAVVLALTPLLVKQLPPDVGVSVVLFDGEELGRPKPGGYCVGSRALAARIATGDDPIWSSAAFGLVLDMVGDADLRLSPEPGSIRNNAALVQRLWSVGDARGHTAFDPTPRAAPIMDDHTFLTEAGIPSVLLIDYEYDVWHTRADTLDRTSGDSLAIVADTVLATLLGLADELSSA